MSRETNRAAGGDVFEAEVALEGQERSVACNPVAGIIIAGIIGQLVACNLVAGITGLVPVDAFLLLLPIARGFLLLAVEPVTAVG